MNSRLHRIDLIRGITLISMILFHFAWDLKYIALFEMNWYTGLAGRIWQRSICISFIVISGFCFALGKSPLKRNLITFACGAVVTIVTLIFMPDNKIVFGILTFIGSAGLIMILYDRLLNILYKKFNIITLNLTLLIGNILFFLAFYNINLRQINLFYKTINVESYMYNGYVATFFGFPDPNFSSTDYFSILPWIFLYFTGYFLYKLCCINTVETDDKTNIKGNENTNKTNGQYNYSNNSRTEFTIDEKVRIPLSVKSKSKTGRFLEFIGRKTLIIYMLHQPVLYLITIIVDYLDK